MNTFHFLSPQPKDLLSLTIEGKWLRLVAISDEFEQDIFQEFTSEITLYMFPSPAEDIEETRSFIVESRRSMQAGNNLQFAILSKKKESFLAAAVFMAKVRSEHQNLVFGLRRVPTEVVMVEKLFKHWSTGRGII